MPPKEQVIATRNTPCGTSNGREEVTNLSPIGDPKPPPIAPLQSLGDEAGIVAAGRSGLRVEVVRSLAELKLHEAAWNRLAWDVSCPASQSGAWTVAYLETLLKPGQMWACLLAFEGDQLLAVLPLLVESQSVLGFQRLHLAAPQRGEMFSGEFVIANGRAADAIPLLLDAVRREFPTFYDISLFRVPAGSPTLPILDSSACPLVPIREPGSPGSQLSTSGSAETYSKSLSHNFSRNLAKARNKLARLEGVRTLFLTGAEAGEGWLPRFLDLEASGWKGECRSAIKYRSVVEFYRPLVSRLRWLGWLEWHLLLSEDRLLAGHLAIRTNRRLTLYKIAYDEAFAACAPGNLLLEKTIQRAFADEDTDVIDCVFDCAWHRNWRMEKRTFYDVWLYPRDFLSLLAGVWVKRVRAQLRRVPALQALRRHRYR